MPDRLGDEEKDRPMNEESPPARGPTEQEGFKEVLSPGPARVWAFSAIIWLLSLGGVGWILSREATTGFQESISWWWLALGFYVAELMVVHIQFRQDAHTISMSEIPMMLGLLLASPGALIFGQLVGSAIALAGHRRQRPMKLFFNVGQLTLQAVVGITVFLAITGGAVSFDTRTVIGAIAAMLATLFTGHAAVFGAIWASGGSESLSETAKVFVVSSVGTVAATLLGFVAAISLMAAPQVFWIGLVPTVLVFIAYRAYVAQVRDKDRVSALFDAATLLHRTPEIEQAVASVAQRVLDLVKAEAAAVILFPTSDDPTAYLTLVDSMGTRESMSPRLLVDSSVALDLTTHSFAGRILRGEQAARLSELLDGYPVHQAVVDVLTVDSKPVGLVTGINRIGEVSDFGESDHQVLATLGSQLSTNLENSRLTDTLTELRVLKTRLEGLIESKDQLVASVSHELRTPLTSVVGLASLVRENAAGSLDQENLELLDLIVEQGHELSNIIEDLLVHARVEAGTLKVFPETFDLAEEIAMVAASHTIEPPEYGGSLWAYADPLRVRQIVRNLITNAGRYGGPRVRIELHKTGNDVSISVIDNGSGVAPNAEKTIFEAYKSAHGPAAQPGSVGLGLALSKSLAQMMDGELVYSRRRSETWFTLSLPGLPTPEVDLTRIPALERSPIN